MFANPESVGGVEAKIRHFQQILNHRSRSWKFAKNKGLKNGRIPFVMGI